MIGYPPGGKGPRRLRKPDKIGSNVNNVLVNDKPEENGSMASNPLFTQEMYEQILNFAKMQQGLITLLLESLLKYKSRGHLSQQVVQAIIFV